MCSGAEQLIPATSQPIVSSLVIKFQAEPTSLDNGGYEVLGTHIPANFLDSQHPRSGRYSLHFVRGSNIPKVDDSTVLIEWLGEDESLDKAIGIPRSIVTNIEFEAAIVVGNSPGPAW